MKKVILQMQLTLDGFVAGPKDELDWMTRNGDDQLKTYVDTLTDGIDTILMGRKMTGSFVSYWEGIVKDHPEDPQHPFAKKCVIS